MKERQEYKMSDGKELTYKEVSEHTSKKDLFIVVHDEVFNASSFVDEHPYVVPAISPHNLCRDWEGGAL